MPFVDNLAAIKLLYSHPHYEGSFLSKGDVTMNTEEEHILISTWSRKGYVIIEDGGNVFAVKDGKIVLLFKREAA